MHGNPLIRHWGSSSACVLEEDAHGDAETRGTISLSSSFYKPRLFKAARRLLYFVPVADLAFGPCQDQKEWKNVSAYLCLSYNSYTERLSTLLNPISSVLFLV